MARIHPTAIVDERADLAEDVEIGAWCMIQGRVKIGPRTRILQHASLRGPITIGCDCVVYPYAALGYAPQDIKYERMTEGAGTQIGDRNIFREGVTVHRATGPRPTTIGHDNYLMVNSHVAHDCFVGNHVTIVNGALVAGHCEVQDLVILAGNAAVHQGCRLGRLSMIAGNRGVTKDLPPFCVVYNPKRVGSLNLIGLRRAGLRRHIEPLREAFDIFYLQGHTITAGVDKVMEAVGHDPIVKEFADFIRGTKRGITPYADSDVMEDFTTPDRQSVAEREIMSRRYNSP